MNRACDVLVIGSGVAGLTAARDAAAAGLSVVVVTRGEPAESNTSWAQGGVAVVRADHDPGDSIGAHIDDTLVAAAGLADPAVVASILTDGGAAVARLQDRGARFDDGPAGLLRTREGGHSANRVIHAGGDATGAEIERALLAEQGRPVLVAGERVTNLLLDDDGAVAGVRLADSQTLLARATVLATGGAGQLWAVTTNPWVATADGLALALRAGADLADLEFMQFHPTVLWTGPAVRGHRPLVTEAVRGEGAVLIDATGARVMAGVHPLADLAPRDVVSLAVSRRMAQAPGGVDDRVFLDATGIAAAVFRRRFPTVTAACLTAGIDPSIDPIPVAPAAHYHCGGVVTDLRGRTTVRGLYAVGEVARTGLHGANRLASNSLLEGLVMGERVARTIAGDLAVPSLPRPVVPLLAPGAAGAGELRAELQSAMSAHAGIGRDATGLAGALDLAHDLARAGDGLADLACTAILTAAALRTTSRGAHVRTDHLPPAADEDRSVVVRMSGDGLTAGFADLRQRVPAGASW